MSKKCKKGFKLKAGKCEKIKSSYFSKKKLSILDLVIFYFLGIYGIIYIFLPHSAHIKGWALDWFLFSMGLPHWAHVTIGVLMIGLLVYLMNKKGFFK